MHKKQVNSLSDVFADNRIEMAVLAKETSMAFTPEQTSKLHQWFRWHTHFTSGRKSEVHPNTIDNQDQIGYHRTMEKTFEQKAQIVASAFYNRYDEEGESEILTKIFDSHDLSGAIALALVSNDIELKSDASKKWIEDTFNVLDSVFDFPDELELVETPLEDKPKKPVAKKKATQPKP